MSAPRGIRNGNAKLTDEQVQYIRTHYRPPRLDPGNAIILAKTFGVNKRTITRIVAGEDRPHVKEQHP